jgi:hypothetical protein
MDTTEKANYCYPQHSTQRIHRDLSIPVDLEPSYITQHQSHGLDDRDCAFPYRQSYRLAHLQLPSARQDLSFLQTGREHTTPFDSTVASSTAISSFSGKDHFEASLKDGELCDELIKGNSCNTPVEDYEYPFRFMGGLVKVDHRQAILVRLAYGFVPYLAERARLILDGTLPEVLIPRQDARTAIQILENGHPSKSVYIC